MQEPTLRVRRRVPAGDAGRPGPRRAAAAPAVARRPRCGARHCQRAGAEVSVATPCIAATSCSRYYCSTLRSSSTASSSCGGSGACVTCATSAHDRVGAASPPAGSLSWLCSPRMHAWSSLAARMPSACQQAWQPRPQDVGCSPALWWGIATSGMGRWTCSLAAPCAGAAEPWRPQWMGCAPRRAAAHCRPTPCARRRAHPLNVLLATFQPGPCARRVTWLMLCLLQVVYGSGSTACPVSSSLWRRLV